MAKWVSGNSIIPLPGSSLRVVRIIDWYSEGQGNRLGQGLGVMAMFPGITDVRRWQGNGLLRVTQWVRSQLVM